MRRLFPALAILLSACSETTSSGQLPGDNGSTGPGAGGDPAPISPQPLPTPHAAPRVVLERIAVEAAGLGRVAITGSVESVTHAATLRLVDLAGTTGLAIVTLGPDGSFRAELAGAATDRFVLDPLDATGAHGLLVHADGVAGRLIATSECLSIPETFGPASIPPGARTLPLRIASACAASLTLTVVGLGAPAEAPPLTLPSGKSDGVTVTLSPPLSEPFALVVRDADGKGRVAALFDPARP